MSKAHQKAITATAYHEAGHAVMALHLGLRLGRHGVSIVPKDDHAGHTHTLLHLGSRHTSQARTISHTVRWRIERRIMVAMAGELTQRVFAPQSVRQIPCRRRPAA